MNMEKLGSGKTPLRLAQSTFYEKDAVQAMDELVLSKEARLERDRGADPASFESEKKDLDALKRQLLPDPKDPEKLPRALEIMRSLLDEYVEENLEGSRMFGNLESEGARFPYSKLSVRNFAKRAYARYAGKEPVIRTEGAERPVRKEFTFSTFLTFEGGSPFVLHERHHQRLLEKLPEALLALERGEEPEEYEIYSIGSPSNILGEVSEAFMEKVRAGNAFDAFGELYGGFIASQIPEDERQRAHTSLYLYGVSMGASMALKAGEYLLQQDLVYQPSGTWTQWQGDAGEEGFPDAPDTTGPKVADNRPRLLIRGDMPVGINEYASAHQIAQGFIPHSIQSIRDEYSRAWIKTEGKFATDAARQLIKRRPDEFRINMDADQTRLKGELLPAFFRAGLQKIPDPSKRGALYGHIVKGLHETTKPSPDIRMRRVFGSADPYTTTPKLHDVIEATGTKQKSLGQNAIPSEYENVSTRGTIGQRHEVPFRRKSARMVRARAIEALLRLERQHRS
jgi:hypothetical protein